MEPKNFTQIVGPYMPIYYAGASGDFNAIHIDAQFAKAVGLGSKILQGLCTMAFAQRLATDTVGDQDPGKLKKLSVRFNAPVRPKDKISLEGEVTDGEGGLKHIGISAKNQDGVEVLTQSFALVEE